MLSCGKVPAIFSKWRLLGGLDSSCCQPGCADVFTFSGQTRGDILCLLPIPFGIVAISSDGSARADIIENLIRELTARVIIEPAGC